jgi:ABC-2 type transport system ATP-binding protein
MTDQSLAPEQPEGGSQPDSTDNQSEIKVGEAATVAALPDIPIALESFNLTKRYPRRSENALTDLSIKVPEGHVFGLIGANGAGKTTFLKICATLLSPTSGDVQVLGKSIRRQPDEVRKLIGYVPDEFGLYDDMQVGEYLDFFAACYGLRGKKRTRLVNELLQLVDLSDKKNEMLKGISRGMKQRLCLAHALVHDPKVLLLDEPASGIDPRARFEMRELLRELSRMGKTIILSSHVLIDLEDICQSIAIIQRGKLVTTGSTEQIANSFGGAALRTVTVRVLTKLDLMRAEEAALEFMQTVKESIIIDEEGRRLEVDIEGDEACCADFLSYLNRSGVHVAHFGQKTARLEEFFLREEVI